jgi:glycolate oxidase FAD binding subunit
MLSYGWPPSKPGTALDLRHLNHVVDYPARDMTVTVQAGITLADLQALLATENQQLPIDVPHPEQATLGGALATNASGPRRLGYGTLRDYVIGMSVIDDEGHETKAGGRVVKNVAGYDLPKLHIGALGTLGVITQVTLKVHPGVGAPALYFSDNPPDRPEELLDKIHASRARPVCATLLNRAAAVLLLRDVGIHLPACVRWVVVVGVEGDQDRASWQVQQLRAGAIDFHSLAGPASTAIWRSLVDFPLWPDARLTFKANLLPGAIAGFCREAEEGPNDLVLHAHASGIVTGHARGDLTLDHARSMLTRLQELAAAAQGNVVLLRCPREWKRELPVWGRSRGDAWLMKAVKERLDPKGIFNPGRFVDGI